MSSVRFPEKQHLKAFIQDIGQEKEAFLSRYLPACDDEWFNVVLDCFQMLQMPYFNGNIANTGAHAFYKLCKNHRLGDGNKRTAVIATSMLLVHNGYFPIFSPDAFYQLAASISASDARQHEWNIEGLKFTFGWSLELLE